MSVLPERDGLSNEADLATRIISSYRTKLFKMAGRKGPVGFDAIELAIRQAVEEETAVPSASSEAPSDDSGVGSGFESSGEGSQDHRQNGVPTRASDEGQETEESALTRLLHDMRHNGFGYQARTVMERLIERGWSRPGDGPSVDEAYELLRMIVYADDHGYTLSDEERRRVRAWVVSDEARRAVTSNSHD